MANLRFQSYHSHRASLSRISSCVLGCVLGFMAVFTLVANRAYADEPAITDFGREENVSVATVHPVHRAVFLTLYADGHHQVCIRTIHGDAQTLFENGRHPWRLDRGLMLFLQLPVYVREVPQAADLDRDSV